jgi:hypothetical protein
MSFILNGRRCVIFQGNRKLALLYQYPLRKENKKEYPLQLSKALKGIIKAADRNHKLKQQAHEPGDTSCFQNSSISKTDSTPFT